MDSDAAQRVRTVVRYLAEKRNTTMFEIGQLLGYSSKSAFSQMVNGKTPVPPGATTYKRQFAEFQRVGVFLWVEIVNRLSI